MGECPSAVRGLIGPCGMCAQCVEAERDDLAASLDTARGERDEARDEVTALRARVEALTAERDDLHALVARQARILTSVADALKGPPPALTARSHHDLGEIAAAVVAAARREGAAEMQERCDDALTVRLVEAVREVREATYRGTGAERDTAVAVRDAVDALRDAIRALPLPGDATPADEATRLRARAAEARAIAAQNIARGLPLSAQSDRRHADELDAEADRLNATGGER